MAVIDGTNTYNDKAINYLCRFHEALSKGKKQKPS